MKILSKLIGILSNGAGRAVADDERHTLDLIAAAGTTDNATTRKKLKAARLRHGKAFQAHAEVERMRVPSPALIRLNEQSAARKAKAKRTPRRVTPTGGVVPITGARRKP